jgi:glycosyltransferase involved in cell wall biosynthesis
MVNGMEPFIHREVDELYKKGLKIILFATKFKEGDIYSPKKEWEFYRYKAAKVLLVCPLLFLRAPLKNLMLLIEATKFSCVPELAIALYYSFIMRQQGVEKIHCHFGDKKLFVGYFRKKILNMPLSVTIHAHELFTNPNPRFFKVAIKACDRIFPIAERWCAKLVAEYDVPAENICLNRLFVDTSVYRPRSSVKILAVGRFTERKGFYILMKAALQLLDLDVIFLFVGFGPLDLRAMAKEFGLTNRVIVYNKMDQD